MDNLPVLSKFQACHILRAFVPTASGKQQHCRQKKQNHFSHIEIPHIFVYLPRCFSASLYRDVHIFPIISDLFPFFNPNLQSVQNLQAVKRLVQETFPIKIREPFQFSEHLRADGKGVQLFHRGGGHIMHGVYGGILPF